MREFEVGNRFNYDVKPIYLKATEYQIDGSILKFRVNENTVAVFSFGSGDYFKETETNLEKANTANA